MGDAAAIAEQLSRVKEYLADRSAPALELDPAFRDYSREALTAVLVQCDDQDDKIMERWGGRRAVDMKQKSGGTTKKKPKG